MTIGMASLAFVVAVVLAAGRKKMRRRAV